MPLMLAALSPARAISDTYRSLSQSLVARADTALTTSRAADADALLDLALTANPGNAEAYILKGRAQTSLGNIEEGLRLLNIGLDIDPLNIDGVVLQGQYALALDDLPQAGQSLKQLRRLCADCPQAELLAAQLNAATQKMNAATQKMKTQENTDR